MKNNIEQIKNIFEEDYKCPKITKETIDGIKKIQNYMVTLQLEHKLVNYI